MEQRTLPNGLMNPNWRKPQGLTPFQAELPEVQQAANGTAALGTTSAAKPKRRGWSEEETIRINKNTGFNLDTKTRVDLGKMIFGKGYKGLRSQNNAIAQYLLEREGNIPVAGITEGYAQRRSIIDQVPIQLANLASY